MGKRRSSSASPATDSKKSKSGHCNAHVNEKQDGNNTVDDANEKDEMQRLDDMLFDIVTRRGPTKSCWPSEIPRKLFNWKCLSQERKKELMIKTRAVAYRRAKEDFLEVLQKGKVVADLCEDTVRGPIRLRMKRKNDRKAASNFWYWKKHGNCGMTIATESFRPWISSTIWRRQIHVLFEQFSRCVERKWPTTKTTTFNCKL
jgi:hypothetical protein